MAVIPGSLCAQEGGDLLLLKAFGCSEVTGITFALLRRFRELVWIGIGLAALAWSTGDSVLLGKTPQANKLHGQFLFTTW